MSHIRSNVAPGTKALVESINGEMEMEMKPYPIEMGICDRCKCSDYCVVFQRRLPFKALSFNYCMQCMEAITYDLIEGVKKIVRNNLEKG